MRAETIIERALTLLGYADAEGNTASPRFQTISVASVNAVYSDLFYISNTEGFIPITSAGDEIRLPERIANDVMPYGVAAFIAQNLGDTVNQQYFSQMYNLKRKTATKQNEIEDKIPTVEGE